jgi:AcrR family transcriptional regulator
VSAEGHGEELGPLPPGRHEYSREQVTHHQRERLIAALAQVVDERGYVDATIADITAAAQVSRRTFYEHFKSKEECFLASFDVVVEHLHGLIEEAAVPVSDWPHRVVAGLRAILRFFAAEPSLARLLMVNSLTAGPVVAARYREVIFDFAPLLKPGRDEHRSPRPLPESTEDTVIGSVASMITRSIIAGETADLESLMPDFTAFVLMPYLGPEQAGRIAQEADSQSP